MRLSARRLPRLLFVLVTAFAPFEERPLTAAVELFRGLAIQLAYRWPTEQILAEPRDRAVLLWSMSHSPRRTHHSREVLGVMAGVVIGIALFAVSNTLLLIPLGAVLRAAGIPGDEIAEIGLALAGIRMLVTLWRAADAYRRHVILARRLPPAATTRWRIDYLAAVPAHAGHGGRLLDQFLAQADTHDAEVVLCCDCRNVPFYRRHGFRLVDGRGRGGQQLMRRQSASIRRCSGHLQARRRRPLASQTS
jgi:hypothetical protein